MIVNTHVSKQGVVKTMNEHERLITLYDGTTIPMDDVLEVEGNIFDSVEPL